MEVEYCDDSSHVASHGSFCLKRRVRTALSFHPINLYTFRYIPRRCLISNMEIASHLSNLQDYAKSLRETRLSSLRHPGEFFNYRQVSRPKDMQEYLKRAGYNL